MKKLKQILLLLIITVTTAIADEVKAYEDSRNDYVYYYNGDSLNKALTMYAKSNGLKIDISNDIPPNVLRKSVSGKFSVASKEALLNALASQYGFSWFMYSGTLYIGSNKFSNRTINVDSRDLTLVRRNLAEVGLLTKQFGYTEIANENKIIINGPQIYNNLVARHISQLGISVSPQQFAVYRLKYASAADIQLSFNGQPIIIPGVATIIQSLLSTGQLPPGSSNAVSPQIIEPIRNQLNSLDTGTNAHVAGRSGESGVNGSTAIPEVQADTRLNSIIIRGTASNLNVYKNLIKMLDIPSPMIQVEILIIHLNQDDLEDAGINWWASTPYGGSAGFGTANLNNPTNNLLLSYNQVNPGQLVVTNLGAFTSSLQFLEQKKLAKTVGRPSLATSDNIPAIVNVSENMFLNGTSGISNNNVNNYNYFQAQITQSLQITPHLIIDDDNHQEIKLSIVLQDGAITDTNNNQIPSTIQSSITSQALITEGQSILLAGYTRTISSEITTQVPFLGSIPLLGWLFKSSSTKKQKIATIYLVTPKLVSQGDLYKLKDYVSIDGNTFNIKNAYQLVPQQESASAVAKPSGNEAGTKVIPIEKPVNESAPVSKMQESSPVIAITETSPVTAPPALPPKFIIVNTSDTLYSIARRYSVTVAQLQACNNLSSTKISIGQKLQICN